MKLLSDVTSRLERARDDFLQSITARRFDQDLIASQAEARRNSRLLILLQNLGLPNDFLPRLFPDPLALRQTLIAPVRFLDLLDRPSELLSPVEISYLRTHRARLILDMSVEAACYDGFVEQRLTGLHHALEQADIDPGKVCLLNANIISQDTLPEWAKRRGIRRHVAALGYNFYFFEYLTECLMSDWFAQIYPAYQEKRRAELTAPGKKLFISLNLRPRPHRTAIVLYLLEKGLFDRSIVSYFGREFGSEDTGSVARDVDTVNFIKALPGANKMLAVLPKLMAMAPIMVDRDSNAMRKDLWQRRPGEISFLFPEATQDGTPVCNSQFEIVTETWFSDDSCLYMTEKTLRPIVRMQPFIVMGSPGALAHLRSLGFYTFAPAIDETYDSIIDPAARFGAVCREIDRLSSLDAAELNRIQESLFPVVKHNADLLLKHGRTIAQKEIFASLSHRLTDRFSFPRMLGRRSA